MHLRTPGTLYLKTWHVYAFVLSGTIVRLLYGLYTKAWLGSPDQLAWGLSLDDVIQNHHFTYKQLMHYPHEGADLFISLLSFCLRPFSNIMPPLSSAALLLDTCSRLIQIRIAQRVFGNKTAGLYAAWSVFSVPLLIPWATVNFGLHSLASFWPFVMLYIAVCYRGKYPAHIVYAAVCCLSVLFNYDNIILLPAGLVLIIRKDAAFRQKLKAALQYATAVFIFLLPAIFLRYYTNAGFPYSAENGSLRGEQWDALLSIEHMRQFITVWHQALPASFLLSSFNFLSSYLQRDIVFGFLICALFIFAIKFRSRRMAVKFCITVVILFMLAYAFSPFYTDDIRSKSYVAYRHMAYIIPVVVLTLLYLLQQIKRTGVYLCLIWICLCSLATIFYFTDTKPATPAYRAAGWVLAQKYGDDRNKLMEISLLVSENNHNEIIAGYGWGLTAALLNNKTAVDIQEINSLVNMILDFPEDERPQLKEGVRYAFEEKITPLLDKNILPLLNLEGE